MRDTAVHEFECQRHGRVFVRTESPPQTVAIDPQYCMQIIEDPAIRSLSQFCQMRLTHTITFKETT